ncbi:site-specific DNA-methyltransferase [Streptomyces sp. NK08204]|uniref:DNA-methyltransferase n=1 Tax=Streptomyces sp. NK08204 TaxID=2873260 RepID=UPI001CEC3DBE|nr:site-specific DNA-methyltransferase [Streptomyces sp. NK08204]
MSKPYYSDDQVTLLLGDALDVLRTLPDGSVNCIVTSPPYYGLRDYGTPGQYGLEATPAEYVETMRRLFAEARRVLADDGTLWLNLGDSYNNTAAGQNACNSNRDGSSDAKQRATEDALGRRKTLLDRHLPPKNLLGIPWRTAFALQDDGWILRNEIVWHKPNAMPESVRDRLSNRHEHLFLFAKSPRYWFDLDAIREPHSAESIAGAKRRAKSKSVYLEDGVGGQKFHNFADVNARGANPGDVWPISTRPYPAAHFAVFPIDLPLRCIKAGCRPGGTVLDTFSGSGTTGAAARQLGRKYIGVDLNPAYHDLAKDRFVQGVLDFDIPA